MACSICFQKTMNILIVTTSFPRWRNDTRAPFIFEFGKALQRKGHKVRVLAMHSPGSKNFENWDGMEIFRPQYLFEKWEILQEEGGGLPEVWKRNKFSRLVIIPFILVHAINVIRCARGYDVIHANWTLSASIARITQIFHRKPVFATIQGSDIFQATEIPFVSKVSCITLNRVNKVFALSHSIYEKLISIGVQPLKIHIIPNGVDVNKFYTGDSKRDQIILFVGSLIERKGPINLLQAYEGIIDKFPSSKLIYIGDGPLKIGLQEMVVMKRLFSNVALLGDQPQEVVSRWMRIAKIFVLPSIEEGLGVVLLEALASGTPCVASNVGGIPDVVTPDVGILVPPKAPVLLQNALIELLIDEKKWISFSTQARIRAEKVFNWDVVISSITPYYEEFLNK